MTKLTGRAAIAYAEAHGIALNKYADPTEDARVGMTSAEARRIAAEDPQLIYLEFDDDDDTCAYHLDSPGWDACSEDHEGVCVVARAKRG